MSIRAFAKKHEANEPITMITCYDYPMASVIAETGVDAVLVGDTVSMIVHGHDDTTKATMDMMIMHIQAVARAKMSQVIVGDLPFLAASLSPRETLIAAGQLIQAGAQAVKMEGCEAIIDSMEACVMNGIPVMAHLGLTPQHVHQLGGFRVQGRTDDAKKRLIEQAKRCEAAGAFALVLECVPADLAAEITQQLAIPTIGIGAGNQTSGQILVLHDMLGLTVGRTPKFVKSYMSGRECCCEAINAYVNEVAQRTYPAKEHEYA